MLLLEGAKTSDVYYALTRARDILQRERWARRYGWARLDSHVDKFDALWPLTPGVGVVAAGLAGWLRGYERHARRLRARELNAAGAVVLRVGDRLPVPEDDLRVIGSVDVGAGDLDGQLREALRYWGAHLDRAASVRALNRGGWGALWPRVLLVGERHHGADPAARPFGEDAGSSEFLSQLLDDAGLPERECHFVNARSATHGDLTWEGVAWLAPRVVVALGEVAAQHLRRLGVRHAALPHPQHLRRFRRAEYETWVHRLDAATAAPEIVGDQTTPAFEGVA